MFLYKLYREREKVEVGRTIWGRTQPGSFNQRTGLFSNVLPRRTQSVLKEKSNFWYTILITNGFRNQATWSKVSGWTWDDQKSSSVLETYGDLNWHFIRKQLGLTIGYLFHQIYIYFLNKKLLLTKSYRSPTEFVLI